MLLRTERISDEQAKVLAHGFGVLIEMLKALGSPEGALTRHRRGRPLVTLPVHNVVLNGALQRVRSN